ncbi:unnamed protein product [Trichogramma brassicae]|uniref:Splicing factor Cactin n=1 Tax=Trichogramma brassicae TaxID=86971 RepID=A0A6H5ID40_9HYME|nr:unnamed protein product [Trichogramma brassicae]
MGWDNDYLHYTNNDNPFGDAHLLEPFVWGKKLEKEGLLEVSREQLELRNKYKQEENRRELEKVKKLRQERELQRQREEEAALEQRGKEASQLELWHRQEDQFHLEQARLRSKIRIQDGRAKPIDLLAKYVGAEDEVDAVEMHEPYTYLRGLQIKDLEDLLIDIKVYKELEKGKNLDYWNDITIIAEDEIHKLQKTKQTEYQVALGRREGIHTSVEDDVIKIIKGKTAAQLVALQTRIEEKISGKAEGVDIGYWESLLSQLKVENVMTAEEKAMHREVSKNMGGDESQFSVESSLEAQVYLWSDKYRPRKPRYFNRVHTGFEWNKYNQTHYDMDNPPPKIVQGYKFNIFYPDLIDKNVTPEYFLTPCSDNKDFALLRFKAGPPYEDIAFKIVNREWEYSYKRGFRCQFHNNIFQLWFHFKRYRYRR